MLAPALKPFSTSRLPENEDDPAPPNVLVPYVKKLPETEATPPKEAVPLVSRSPEINKSLDAEM